MVIGGSQILKILGWQRMTYVALELALALKRTINSCFCPAGKLKHHWKRSVRRHHWKESLAHQVNTKITKNLVQTEYSRWHVMDRAAMMAKNQKEPISKSHTITQTESISEIISETIWKLAQNLKSDSLHSIRPKPTMAPPSNATHATHLSVSSSSTGWYPACCRSAKDTWPPWIVWDGPAGDGPHLGPLNKCKDSPKSWKPLDSGTANTC